MPCSTASARARCLAAATTNRTFVIQATATDRQWPRWSRAVAELGLGAVLSIHLFTDEQMLGALNLYAGTDHVYDSDEIETATIVAAHVSVALARLRLQSDLWKAIDARHLVGMAQGILMSATRSRPSRRSRSCGEYSQNSNVRLHIVAQQVVTTRALPPSERDLAIGQEWGRDRWPSEPRGRARTGDMTTSPRTSVLLRHGKSAYPGGVIDHDRPLAARGRREAALAGEVISRLVGQVDAVLCSTATRTREILAATGIDAPVQFDDGLYDASPGEILDRITALTAGRDEAPAVLLVVGHSPGMPGTALTLADERSDRRRPRPGAAPFPDLGAGRAHRSRRLVRPGRRRATLTDLVIPRA